MKKELRDFANALFIALLSIGLMVGALSISLVIFDVNRPAVPTSRIPPLPSPSGTSVVLPTPAPSMTATIPPIALQLTETSAVPQSLTAITAIPAACTHPYGWVQITIQVNDTLSSLSVKYNVSKESLKSGNCLTSDALIANTKLYVPPTVSANTSSSRCVPGAAAWIKTYSVKAGDTIYSIAKWHGTTASQLKTVNCKTSDLIYSGELLWVPNHPTQTPSPTFIPPSTITSLPTQPLTNTALPFTITVTVTPEAPTATP